MFLFGGFANSFGLSLKRRNKTVNVRNNCRTNSYINSSCYAEFLHRAERKYERLSKDYLLQNMDERFVDYFKMKVGRGEGRRIVKGNFRLFGWLVGFLTSSSTTSLYRGLAPRQFYVLPHVKQSWETMNSVTAGHIDTDLTSRERAATVGIESGTSSPGVARSTD